MSGRAALVTGAASGIGRATAELLSHEGWSVLAVDLAPDSNGPGEPFAADLATRSGNGAAAVAAALERFGRLDAVVPNAGFQHVAPIEDFPEDVWERLLAVLLTSPFLLAKHGVLGLVKTLALEGAADAIAVSAVCPGYVWTPLVESQVAAQAAAHGVPEERVLEDVLLAPQAVRELLEPEAVAEAVAYLLGPAGRFATGSPPVLDGGWTAR